MKESYMVIRGQNNNIIGKQLESKEAIIGSIDVFGGSGWKKAWPMKKKIVVFL